MSILYVLLPLALVLGGGFLAAFIWSTESGQFDDLDRPALRILESDHQHEKGPSHE